MFGLIKTTQKLSSIKNNFKRKPFAFLTEQDIVYFKKFLPPQTVVTSEEEI
jgi:hypothetical protein